MEPVRVQSSECNPSPVFGAELAPPSLEKDMNKQHTMLIITASLGIAHDGDYEELRDKVIQKLEADGWNVDIEEEFDD